MDPSTLTQNAPQTETHAQWMERVLCTRCKVTKLWPYQLKLSLDIDNRKHVFCVIATGMG